MDADRSKVLAFNGGLQKSRDFMKNLEVVNDCAERGIKKLITDFKDMVHKEDQLQSFFQFGKDRR
jgi:hypothetical protein